MNFFKSLVLYDYLYSPKSWLHKQKNSVKAFMILLYLISLPYISLKKIFVSLLIYILIYKSMYIPRMLTYNLYRIFLLFSLFILINIQPQKQILEGLKLGREYVIVPMPKRSFFEGINFKSIYNEYLFKYCYIPSSLLRILSVNFLYLAIIKILLLTTSYKKIINSYFYYLKNTKNNFINKFIFEVQISIQFLNTIFLQIKILKMGYSTRFIKKMKRFFPQHNFLIIFFCTQQLLFNIYEHIYYLSNTVYYYEIHDKNINIIYNRLR